MFVASYDGMVELDSEFGDPMFCPGRGDNALEPMEIKGHKHAHKRDNRAVQRWDFRYS